MEPEKGIFEEWGDTKPSLGTRFKWKFEIVKDFFLYDIKNGVSNLIKWFPIIWKDRDYDHRFILTLLAQKLKHQSKYIGDRDFHTTAKRDAEIMMTCVRLINKIEDGFYECEYLEYEKTKFWFEPRDTESSYLKSRELSNNREDYFKKYPLVYGKMKEEYPNDSESRIALKISTRNHIRARKLLFKIMEENIEKWWD